MYRTVRIQKENYDYLLVMLYNEFNHEYQFRMDTNDNTTEHLENLYSIIDDLEPKDGFTPNNLRTVLRNKIAEVKRNGIH